MSTFEYWETPPTIVPSVVFQTRVRDDSIGGPNPYRWEEVNSYDLFAGKRVVLFSLPGAFTPTCSAMQLPTFEKRYDEFKYYGIDEVYCISVNDAFVMNKWAQDQGLEKVKVIPDGNAEFTSGMRMGVNKWNLGFGLRSWRYAVIVDNGKIEKWFVEDGKVDNAKDDPYGISSPENILEYLKNNKWVLGA
jgi:peroxiredoxin